MTKFWQLNEDPFYDDDGVLIDEDDWATAPTSVPEDETIDPKEWDQAFPRPENYDPFATVNS